MSARRYRWWSLAPAIAAFAALAGCGGGGSSAPYRVTDIGALNDNDSAAIAINRAGQVAAEDEFGTGGGLGAQAFLWQNGKRTSLGALGGNGSSVGGIN